MMILDANLVTQLVILAMAELQVIAMLVLMAMSLYKGLVFQTVQTISTSVMVPV